MIMRNIKMTTLLLRSYCYRVAVSIVLLLCCTTSYGIIYSNGGIKYELGNNTATVCGLEDFNLTDIVIPSMLTYNGIDYTVTLVQSMAFKNCDNITSVVLPNNIISIGESAFLNCSNLESVVLPTNLETIGESVFRYCSSLQSVVIPKSVTSIRESAFSHCKNLDNVKIESDIIRTIDNDTFYGCEKLSTITIPSSVETIGSCAFYCCSSLQEIELPKQLKSVGGRAFSGCTSLKSIEIPSSVTNLGRYCLEGCSALENISIPFVGTELNPESSSENTLFGSIFSLSECPGSKEIIQVYYPSSSVETRVGYYIPTGLSKVKVTGSSNLYSAFSNCDVIKEIELSGDIETIGKSSFMNCTGLVRLSLPETLTTIEENAFKNCTDLQILTLPESVTTIKSGAFSGCTNIDSLVIPKNMTSIASGAFNGCPLSVVKLHSGNIPLSDISTQVQNCVIGGNLESIKEYCFRNCNDLDNVTIEEGCRRIEDHAFINSSVVQLHLPMSLSYFGRSNYNKIITLTYRGMEEDWAKVENNSGLTPSVYHYGIIIPGEEFDKDGIYYCANDTAPATVRVLAVGDPISNHVYIPRDVTMEGRTFKVTHIADNAFRGCDNIDTIFYGGSRIEWQKIFFGQNNDILLNTPIVYNYQKKGNEEPNLRNYIHIVNSPINICNPILSINLNTDLITGLQFELELPEGFSVAKDENEKYKVSLSVDRSPTGEHNILEISKLNNGRYLCICSSTSNAVFEGNEGELLSIELNIDESATSGEYVVNLKNISLSDNNADVYRASEKQFPISLISYILGDVSGDLEISVTDVVSIIDNVLGENSNEFIFRAADMNGDGEITVTDAISVIDIILEKNK